MGLDKKIYEEEMEKEVAQQKIDPFRTLSKLLTHVIEHLKKGGFSEQDLDSLYLQLKKLADEMRSNRYFFTRHDSWNEKES